MKTERICEQCGASLRVGAPEGLCPQCLMKAGLGSQASPTEAQPAAGPHPLPDSAKLAEYLPQLEILELLGQGGMGAVYKARQPALDRVVALKILPPRAAADPGFAERFTREARTLAKLSHPNIVAIYDFGQVHGLSYLIMEYVEGANLRQLEQAGRLSPAEALRIIPKLCEALQAAHDEGIVHRDIKPENVLLDQKGRVKIADFGLAKILGRETPNWRLTGAKDVMGTPHYMAPEQAEHPQAVDHRADIYSLGVVFYEMLTGELPLGKFAPPSRKVQVDVRLDEVVLRALEKEPQRRYQQASQVKSDVETIADSSSGAPQPPAASPAGDNPYQQVKGPAIGLMITGILNWIAIPFLAAAGAIMEARWQGALIWLPLAALVIGGVIFGAGLKLKRLEAFRLSVIGSLLASLISPGNLLGLPIGIWALVVLARREVRAAFALKARGGSVPSLPPVVPGGGTWKVAAVLAAALLLALAIPVGGIVAAIAIPNFVRARARAHILSNRAPVFVVKGEVKDAVSGKPIQGARVADWFYGRRENRAIQTAGTDALGHYELKTWHEEHSITASAPGYQTSRATLLISGDPLAGARLDFQLQPTHSAPPAAEAAPASPKITATAPKAGATEVDPALGQITVTFDQDMREGFSWTGGGPEFPPAPQGVQPHWLDRRTCALPVKLEAGRYYRVGINSTSYQNFCTVAGQPAKPSVIYFTTRGAAEEVKARMLAPQIASFLPANRDQRVSPELTELRITFNVPMGRGCSWCSAGDDGSDFPKGREGKAAYWLDDQKTCVLPVALEPGKAYRLSLNSPWHINFQSLSGVPLEPVDYTFRTANE